MGWGGVRLSCSLPPPKWSESTLRIPASRSGRCESDGVRIATVRSESAVPSASIALQGRGVLRGEGVGGGNAGEMWEDWVCDILEECV